MLRHTYACLCIIVALTGSCVAQAQDLYESDGTGNINMIAPNGTVTTFVTLPGSAPRGLVFDKTGNLYAADANSGIIYKIAP